MRVAAFLVLLVVAVPRGQGRPDPDTPSLYHQYLELGEYHSMWRRAKLGQGLALLQVQ